MTHQPGPTSAAPFASTRRPISRRRFLRGAGVALALPLLEAMRPPFARAADGPVPRRLFGVCNNLGLLPGPVLPQGRRPRLHPLAVPETAPGPPRRLHRPQRRVAPGRGRRPPVGHRLPDRRPAPGQQLVPQHHLARPARGREDRHAHPVPVADAGGQRRPQPVVDADRRGDPAGGAGVAGVQPALPAGVARRGRGAGPRTRHRAEHPGRGRRAGEGPAEGRRRPRPRPARPVLLQRPRPGAPAPGVEGVGEQAEAEGEGQPRRPTRPARRSTWPGCRSCTTWCGWPSRPTRPARSR